MATIKNLNDGSITFSDGTGTPVTMSVPYTTGDLSIDGLAETQNEVVAYETRGTLNSVRHTARTYPSGSLSFQIADFTDATVDTAIDFALKQNKFSTNTSTLSTDVYAFDIILTVEGTDFGDAADETITMTDCHVTTAVAEGDPNTGTMSFICYGTVTFA